MTRWTAIQREKVQLEESVHRDTESGLLVVLALAALSLCLGMAELFGFMAGNKSGDSKVGRNITFSEKPKGQAQMTATFLWLVLIVLLRHLNHHIVLDRAVLNDYEKKFGQIEPDFEYINPDNPDECALVLRIDFPSLVRQLHQCF